MLWSASLDFKGALMFSVSRPGGGQPDTGQVLLLAGILPLAPGVICYCLELLLAGRQVGAKKKNLERQLPKR